MCFGKESDQRFPESDKNRDRRRAHIGRFSDFAYISAKVPYFTIRSANVGSVQSALLEQEHPF